MKQTILYKYHTEIHQAKMAPFAGFAMPLQYTSAKEEINAVRTHAGIFDVSHMGEFIIEGKNCSEFIDFLIANDYQKLPIGKAIYSPLCHENGGIIDDLIVYKLAENKALMCVNAANIDKDWNWIVSQKNNFEVSLNNISNETSLIAIQGPNAIDILTKCYDKFSNELNNLPYYGVFNCEELNIIFARTGYTGEDGFEIFAKNQDIEHLWPQLVNNGAIPCGLAARDTLRLEVCYPLYGHELNDQDNPKESALTWTIKKNNNNYIGKVAIDTSEIKTTLIKLSLEKLIPREGYKVFIEENCIGEVTSGTFSPTISQGIAIARVKNIKNLKEEDLLIEIRGKKYPAKYHSKAFYAGELKK